MNKDEITAYWRFAESLADSARGVTLPLFRGKTAIENKTDGSPVTTADRECESLMRASITSEYPAHHIYGEEFGGDTGDGFVWVLDPIDGTRSFISGSRQYCTLIALVHDGSPILGVIDMPALDERWMGCDIPSFQRAVFNGAPCRVSGQRELSKSVMATTTLGVAEDERDESLRRLCRRAGHSRLGGDASAFGSLASGFLDMAADYEMACYDYLPLMPVIRAAGGILTDWRGEIPAFSGDKTGFLASATEELHLEGLSVL